jgi:hypothetical protein
MRLGIVFDKFKAVFLTESPYPISIGTTTIEMNYHDGSGARGDCLLDESVVNLERSDVGLYKNGLETVLRNSEDAGNISIGRYDDFIPLVHDPELLIGSEYECQGIKAIATTYAVPGTDILCIVQLKAFGGLSFKIPSTLQHLIGSMHIGRINLLQIQVFHSVHS